MDKLKSWHQHSKWIPTQFWFPRFQTFLTVVALVSFVWLWLESCVVDTWKVHIRALALSALPSFNLNGRALRKTPPHYSTLSLLFTILDLLYHWSQLENQCMGITNVGCLCHGGLAEMECVFLYLRNWGSSSCRFTGKPDTHSTRLWRLRICYANGIPEPISHWISTLALCHCPRAVLYVRSNCHCIWLADGVALHIPQQYLNYYTSLYG